VQTLVAVDPGKNCCGVSFWTRPGPNTTWTLQHAYAVEAYALVGVGTDEFGFLEPMRWRSSAQAVFDTLPGEPTFLVLETMTVYVRAGGDTRDLLFLQAICGALAGICSGSKVISMEPRTWKGQVPRDVFGARVEQHLRDAGTFDKVVIVPRLKTQLNDAMHAVGLGRSAVDKRLPDLLFNTEAGS